MGAYVVGFYTTWGQAFPKSYADQALRLVEKHGGRFLVRPSCHWEVLEGDPPRPDPGMVVIEFPSIEKARAREGNLASRSSSATASPVTRSLTGPVWQPG